MRKKMLPSATFYINDVYHPSCERFADEFRDLGPIEIVDSAKEVATRSKVVISIVPGAGDVRKIYLDETTGMIAATKDPNRLMVECSTID